MDRNRLIVGFAIPVVSLLLVILGSVLLNRWQDGPPQTGHRYPLPRLAYCAPSQAMPCVISFDLDSDGQMAINLRTENLSSPDFNIKIVEDGGEHIYFCRRTSRLSLSVMCTGAAMPAGQDLRFLVLAKRDNRVLAQGTFPIIGLAMATPEPARTPTSVPSFDRPPR